MRSQLNNKIMMDRTTLIATTVTASSQKKLNAVQAKNEHQNTEKTSLAIWNLITAKMTLTYSMSK